MILTWLIIVPAGGGLLAWMLSRWYPAGPRWISLLALAINLILTLTLVGTLIRAV